MRLDWLRVLVVGLSEVREPRIAGTEGRHTIYATTGRARWCVQLPAGLHTRPQDLLTLPGGKALIRAKPIWAFGEAVDDGLLTRAFGREPLRPPRQRRPISWSRLRAAQRADMPRGAHLPYSTV